jgi:hypothetical protein
MRQEAISIPANIAEGFRKRGESDKTRHPLNSATPELLQLLLPQLLNSFLQKALWLSVKGLFAAGATEIERSAFVFRLIG